MSENMIPANKQLLELMKQVDSAVSAVAAKFSEEFKCHKGCSDCCYAAFDVSLAEGVLILEHFNRLGRKTRKQVIKKARQAQKQWEKAISQGADLALTRIPCPLLNLDDQCLMYEVRPVNCRTYGAPTEINGKGHVCALSGISAGKTYPTVRLHMIQARLLDISMQINPNIAERRWPISDILLGAIDDVNTMVP